MEKMYRCAATNTLHNLGKHAAVAGVKKDTTP